MRTRSKTNAGRSHEEERYTATKIKIAVSMMIAIEDRQGSNIATELKNLNTVLLHS